MTSYLMRILALLCCLATPLAAQETEDDAGGDVPADVIEAEIALAEVFEDQAEWAAFAERVSAAVDAGRASNSVLSELRAELSDWRDIFLKRQSINSARITTVRAQIAALGDVPESGAEDPRVAGRRAELNAQLQQLQAPGLLATEAYTQANGLIGEVDKLIRDRQADEFTERTQSPLNPQGWTRALESLSSAYLATKAEVQGAIANPSRQTELVNNSPVILALLAVAVVFVLRGGVWIERLASRIVANTERGQGVWRFILSLGQIVVPMIGIIAFTNAMDATGMLGRRLQPVVMALPYYGLFPVMAHWLAGHLLPTDVDAHAHPLGISRNTSVRARRMFIAMGYLLMLLELVLAFAESNAFDEISIAVIIFPIGFMIAWTVFWLGHGLRRSAVVEDDDARRSFRLVMRSITSRSLKAAAVFGVLLTILGFANGFEMVTAPAAMTLYVLGILLLLQRLSVDGYSLLSRTESSAQDALMPVLIGFALVLVSLPILALIWGAQVTDLTELWARFREGFSLGETRISPSNFLLFALVFAAGYTVTRLVQGALRSTVLPRTKMDAGGQNAIVSGTGYIGIFLAAVIAITTAGIDLSGLAIVAGALSVGIGFGLQNIVSNFISGIILLIERPISQGDWIEVNGQMGYVRDISVRSTRIETFDRTDVIVPNADLISGQVTNWTRGNSVGRAIVPVGVAYGTDTEKVTNILRKIAEANPMVLMNPPPNVLFTGFGADSLDFEIRAILRDVNYVMQVKSEMNHEIAKRFTEAGIEIPFGQRDIWLRNPEALAQSLSQAAKPNRDDESTA